MSTSFTRIPSSLKQTNFPFSFFGWFPSPVAYSGSVFSSAQSSGLTGSCFVVLTYFFVFFQLVYIRRGRIIDVARLCVLRIQAAEDDLIFQEKFLEFRRIFGIPFLQICMDKPAHDRLAADVSLRDIVIIHVQNQGFQILHGISEHIILILLHLAEINPDPVRRLRIRQFACYASQSAVAVQADIPQRFYRISKFSEASASSSVQLTLAINRSSRSLSSGE